MWSIHSNQRSGSEVRAIQKFEIGRLTSAKNSGIPYETLPLFPPPSPSPLLLIEIGFNISASLMSHLSQKMERANALLNEYEVLEFLNFLYLLHLIQYIFSY